MTLKCESPDRTLSALIALELLEVREILGVDTLEAFYCLLDIIGKALDVPI